MKRCKEENCKERHYAKEYCRKHYRKFSGEHSRRYNIVKNNPTLLSTARTSRIKYLDKVKNEEWFKEAHKRRQREYYHRSEKRRESLKKWKEDKLYGGNRDTVFKRDNYKCVSCGMSNEEHLARYGRKLSIHHINHLGYNVKIEDKDNRLINLVTLCLPCHGREDKKIDGYYTA